MMKQQQHESEPSFKSKKPSNLHLSSNPNSASSSSFLHSRFSISNDQIMIPQSPAFDTSYGTSLLPRQLLMGSPFVSTPVHPMPILNYGQFQQQQSPVQQYFFSGQQQYQQQNQPYYGGAGYYYGYGYGSSRNGSVTSLQEHSGSSDGCEAGSVFKLNKSSDSLRFRRRSKKHSSSGLSKENKQEYATKEEEEKKEGEIEIEEEEEEEDDDVQLQLLEATPSKNVTKKNNNIKKKDKSTVDDLLISSPTTTSSSSTTASSNPMTTSSTSSQLNFPPLSNNIHSTPINYHKPRYSYANLTGNMNVHISPVPTRHLLFQQVNSIISITEFLDSITYGPIQGIRVIKSHHHSKGTDSETGDNNIILTFLTTSTSLSCYNNLLTYFSIFKKQLKSEDTLSVRFVVDNGNNMSIMNIRDQVREQGVSRCVVLSKIQKIFTTEVQENEEKMDDEMISKIIKDELGKFGKIEKVEIIRSGKEKEEEEEEVKGEIQISALVHFWNIVSAIKCMELLKLTRSRRNTCGNGKEYNWNQVHLLYGVDRCQQQSLEEEDDEANEEEEEDVGLQEQEQGIYYEEQGYYQNSSSRGSSSVDPLSNDLDQYPQFITPQPEIQQQQQQGPVYSTPLMNRSIFLNEQQQQNQNFGTGLNLSTGSMLFSTNPFAQTNQSSTMGSFIFNNKDTNINNSNNRTICLGNLHPQTTPEDICNVIRGGILQSIKHFASRRICFITFVHSSDALNFFNRLVKTDAKETVDEIRLYGKRLKIGWGKESGPVSREIELAVTIGASRNIYIGCLDSDGISLPTLEEVKSDFENSYGLIEQVNYIKTSDGSPKALFVNFMNIVHAIRLLKDLENDPINFHQQWGNKYSGLKFGFGKDRCGNMPKVGSSSTKGQKKKRKNKDGGKRNVDIEEALKEEEEQQEEMNDGNNSQIVDTTIDSSTTSSTTTDFEIITSPPSRQYEQTKLSNPKPKSKYKSKAKSKSSTQNIDLI